MATSPVSSRRSAFEETSRGQQMKTAAGRNTKSVELVIGGRVHTFTVIAKNARGDYVDISNLDLTTQIASMQKAAKVLLNSHLNQGPLTPAIHPDRIDYIDKDGVHLKGDEHEEARTQAHDTVALSEEGVQDLRDIEEGPAVASSGLSQDQRKIAEFNDRVTQYAAGGRGAPTRETLLREVDNLPLAFQSFIKPVLEKHTLRTPIEVKGEYDEALLRYKHQYLDQAWERSTKTLDKREELAAAFHKPTLAETFKTVNTWASRNDSATHAWEILANLVQSTVASQTGISDLSLTFVHESRDPRYTLPDLSFISEDVRHEAEPLSTSYPSKSELESRDIWDLTDSDNEPIDENAREVLILMAARESEAQSKEISLEALCSEDVYADVEVGDLSTLFKDKKRGDLRADNPYHRVVLQDLGVTFTSGVRHNPEHWNPSELVGGDTAPPFVGLPETLFSDFPSPQSSPLVSPRRMSHSPVLPSSPIPNEAELRKVNALTVAELKVKAEQGSKPDQELLARIARREDTSVAALEGTVRVGDLLALYANDPIFELDYIANPYHKVVQIACGAILSPRGLNLSPKPWWTQETLVKDGHREIPTLKTLALEAVNRLTVAELRRDATPAHEELLSRIAQREGKRSVEELAETDTIRDLIDLYEDDKVLELTPEENPYHKAVLLECNATLSPTGALIVPEEWTAETSVQDAYWD